MLAFVTYVMLAYVSEASTGFLHQYKYTDTGMHKRNEEGDQGGPWTPRRSQICHQKVPKLTSEGPQFYLRSNNGIKSEENARLCLHNPIFEGPELFGPPKF